MVTYYVINGVVLSICLYLQYLIFNTGGSKKKVFFKSVLNVLLGLVLVGAVGLGTGETVKVEKVDPEKYEIVKHNDYVLFAFPDHVDNRTYMKREDYYIWKYAQDTSKVWFEISYVKPRHGEELWSFSKELETAKD